MRVCRSVGRSEAVLRRSPRGTQLEAEPRENKERFVPRIKKNADAVARWKMRKFKSSSSPPLFETTVQCCDARSALATSRQK